MGNRFSKKGIIFGGVLLIILLAGILFAGTIKEFVTERIFIANYSHKSGFWDMYPTMKENKAFIKRNPKNDSAYYSLGQGYYSLQAYDLAADAFSNATQIVPENDAYWFFLAQTYQAKKTYQSSRDAYIKAVTLAPSRPIEYTKLAWLYYFRLDSEKDKAFEVLKEGLAAFPTDKDILFDITRYYLYDGNKEEFLKYASRYMKIDPNQELIKKTYEEWRK